MCGFFKQHRHLGSSDVRSLEQHRHLGAWMCVSLRHHWQLWCLDVREPRAPSTPWWLGCAGVSRASAPWCFDLIFAGASDTIRNLGAWMCGSLEEGGRRKPNALMEDFCEIVDELSMVELKTDNEWFTWVNNNEGTTMVKERLDRFFISTNDVNNFPFLKTKVLRQSSSDHDAIILDTQGRRPRDNLRDPRLCFKYEVCWAKNEEAKKVINEAWQRGT
ncbi:hypothetical protein GOBAR_DD14313 [Gossypium barbadense]|nr:hypothetical protein GOBAR_DD14313 [Gossypium barbadense]